MAHWYDFRNDEIFTHFEKAFDLYAENHRFSDFVESFFITFQCKTCFNVDSTFKTTVLNAQSSLVMKQNFLL